MFKRRRMRRRAAAVLAALLIAAALCGTLCTSPYFSLPEAAVYCGSFLLAPKETLGVLRTPPEDARETSAHTVPEAPVTPSVPAHGDGAAFWTQMPAVPAKPAPPAAFAPVQTCAPAPVPEAPVPEGMVPLVQKYYPQGHGAGYVPCGSASVRNCTEIPDSELAGGLMQPLPFSVELNSSEPQVLILHTHATECYEDAERAWCDPEFTARTTDLSRNVTTVGAQIAQQLNTAGIRTLHDTTLHDYPSYNASYGNSRRTAQRYLREYPSIKIILDVHRDAIQYPDGTRVKPAVQVGGQKAAQVMMICGADVDGNLPNCRQNLCFAARWQDQTQRMFPGLVRPVLFDYRFYNQDLSTGSLLLEMGGHASTLAEAQYSGRLIGQSLSALLTAP